jgi:peroxiredoxin Q/BCP
MAQLAVGDTAPDFNLLDQTEKMVELSGYRGRRDVLGDIGDTAVIGISPDAPSKQAKFDQKYGLGFPLLSDADHAVAEAFGVWKEKSMYGKRYMGIERSAFLIDEDGAIAEAWYKISPKDTAASLIKALKAEL